MTSKSMTFRFPAPLAQAIEAQARAMGKDRTTVVAEALAQSFSLSMPSKTPVTLEMLQRQVMQSEHSITLLSEQLVSLRQAIRADSSALGCLELLEQFSHSLRALLSTTLAESQIDSTPQTVALTRCSQEPSTSVRSPLPALQATPHLLPQIDLPERILTAMSDPVFVCDRLQRVLYVNLIGARSLGLEDSAAQLDMLQDSNLPSELKAQLTTQIETVFAIGRSITSEIKLTTPFYGLRDYEYTLSPFEGSIDHIDAVLFSTRDITERKQVETALREAEANYQHLFESTNDSILILDASTQHILNANTNAVRRLGYTRQQLLKLDMDAIIPQWSMDVGFELSQRLRVQGKSVFKHYLCHKDGTEIPVEISSRLSEYGDRLAIQSFIHDLSEPKHCDGDRDQAATA